MTEAEIAREMMADFCRTGGGTFRVSENPEEFRGKIAIYYYAPDGKGYAAVEWTAVQALEQLVRKLEVGGSGSRGERNKEEP